MSVHRRGRKWVVRYEEGGKQRQRTFDLKDHASDFDTEVRRRRQLGTLASLRDRPRTLDDYAGGDWARDHGALLAPRTRGAYSWAYDSVVGPRLGSKELHAITPQVVARWQATLVAAKVGHPTIVKARAVLGSVLQAAVEDGLLQVNPVRSVRAPRAPMRPEARPLAPARVEAIRAVCGARDAALVSVLAYAGLRPQEARTLRWRDVGERTLVVNAAKTSSRRTVRLLASLAADLREWRMACGRPDDGELVFPNARGEELSARSFNAWRGSAWTSALERIGAPYQRPYDLRHSFASLLLHEGRSVVYVARQLGHSTAVCMSTYLHVVDELEDAPRLGAEDAITKARAKNNLRAGFAAMPGTT